MCVREGDIGCELHDEIERIESFRDARLKSCSHYCVCVCVCERERHTEEREGKTERERERERESTCLDYRLAKTHRMPSLYRSLSAKEPYN